MASVRKLKIQVDSTGNAKEGLKGIAGSLASLGPAGVAAAAVAGLGAVGLATFKVGQKLVELGSEAEEMTGKFDVVFGEGAPAATAALDEFGNAVGRNKFVLMEMASTVQDTFVPLGFARDTAADMSIELTKLAVDMGSFNNVADEQVMLDLQSAIVGNHETMRKYGVVITQTTLDQELLSMGVQGGIKDATEQEKVQARLNIIMAGTSDAHGDAAATAGSWANQMRGLKGELKETFTTIGMELLPVVTPLLAALKNLATKVLPPLLEGFKKVMAHLKTELAPVFVVIKDSIGRIAEAMSLAEGGAIVLKIAVGVLKLGLDGVVLVAKLVALGFVGIAEVIERIRASIDVVISGFRLMRDAIRDTMNAMPDWLIPGSPTPFEMGLRGIGKTLGELDIGAVGRRGGLAMAGAGAGAGAGGGVTWTGDFVYAPAVSLGDQAEAEEKILPLLLDALRKAGVKV